jgi:hypothetical protein
LKRLEGGGVSVFHRPRKAEFEHFTLEQRRVVNIAISRVEKLLQIKAGQTFGVENYLEFD